MNELFYNVKMPNLDKKKELRDMVKEIAKTDNLVAGQVILNAMEVYYETRKKTIL
jgi:hypothetical protein